LKPADTDAAIRGVRSAVKQGRLNETRINVSVRKVLAAKYDLGLVRQRLTPLDEIDLIVGGKQTLELAAEIAKHAVTLVRNDAGLLPLNLAPNATIFNLAITNGDDRLYITQPFVAALARSGRKVITIVLDDRSATAEVKKALDLAGHADIVIASLYGRVRTGQARSVGLPDPGANALTALIDRKAPIIGISFGNPYLLSSFPKLQTYLVAYGDMPSLQEAAAQALLGQSDITGRLPISLPGLYPRGTGIQLAASKK
jgi:beta-N-acetylhexosaminidase